MLITGEWLECDDGVIRPVIHGEVLSASGSWIKADFLLDIGADRTVFDSVVLSLLGLDQPESQGQLGGIGGRADAVLAQTKIRLPQERGEKVTIQGPFFGVTNRDTLDMSVLGRDVTDLFAAIIDRPGNVVCLLGQHHRYRIEYIGS